ncbi:MAG: hypothetical protein ACFFAJ_17975, partial [Candidatus Hodarchaeota archaeon]
LKKSLKRTQELVSKVRTLSNARDIQQVDLAPINLLQSLNNAVYLLKEEYPNIEIKMIGAIEENMLVKATNMLEQLFLNILVTVFDIENHPLSIIRITIEPISGYYRINFDSHRIPPEVSERVLFGSIIDEIGGSRSDLSSLSHLIINSLVAKYKGNITFKHISEPEENDRISIDLPRVIN